MRVLIVFVLVGLGAQLVDGALGMAFGVTATSLLLLSGVSAAQASFAVHLAEIGTTLASGLSHWRFRNVDWKVVAKLGIPGAVGAFAGATVLSGLSTEAALPWTSAILAAVGIYLLVRFGLGRGTSPVVHVSREQQHSARFLVPLGVAGGFVDASGGGGWGPITTSTLLSAGKTTPRRVIGSVSAAEFLVSLAASVGFLLGLGPRFAELGWTVLGLLLGGVLAAPVAAWLVSRIDPVVLGTAVGGLLVVTNAAKLGDAFSVPGNVTLTVVGIVVIATIALAFSARARRRGAGRGAVSTGVDTGVDSGAGSESAQVGSL